LIWTLRSSEISTSLRDAVEHQVSASSGSIDELKLQANLLLGKTNPLPQTISEWQNQLKRPGNPLKGRRIFFSSVVGCSRCHVVQNRGGQIGPDLSLVGRGLDEKKLLLAILQPSAEIAPLYSQYQVTLRDGQEIAGLLENQRADGTLVIRSVDGIKHEIPSHQVMTKNISKISLMPEGLPLAMTVQDMRDLLAFLITLR
jgi:putative heme-binding domain-containing protein